MVDEQDDGCSSTLAANQWIGALLPRTPFSCKACLGTNYLGANQFHRRTHQDEHPETKRSLVFPKEVWPCTLSTMLELCGARCSHSMLSLAFEDACQLNLFDPDLSSRLSAHKCCFALGCRHQANEPVIYNSQLKDRNVVIGMNFKGSLHSIPVWVNCHIFE